MRRWLDESKQIARLIDTLSNSLAKRQGLVPLIGILLALIGFIILLVNIFVPHRALELVGLSLQSIGIIAALIGLLLSEPLGK
jgi:flagellar motor component MotA